jgi:glycosyltransferase involved in cell wall biosynthesis
MTGVNRARILFVAAQSGFLGGAERYIYDAARALGNHGFEVDGLFIDRGGDSVLYESVFSRVYDRTHLAQLKPGDYDLVFIHKIHDPAVIRLLRTNFKTAVMVHDHEYCCLRPDKSYPFFGARCLRPFKLLFCSLCGGLVDRSRGSVHCLSLHRRRALVKEIKACDAYIVTSTFMRDELLYNGFDVARMVKIYPVCSVSPRRTRVRKSNETPVIVFAGQLIREKGVKLLLEALSMVRYEFKAYIIGTGPEEKRCRRLATRLWLDREIEFTGWQDDLSGYFEKADIAVFPAIGSEPFGQAGPEAQAYGLPVVGFDCGGVGEWLRHERSGLLVPRKDIRGFADALEMLINDPGYACRLGDEGRTWVETYMSEASYVSGFKLMLDRVHSR